MSFDITTFFRTDLPDPAAAPWREFPKYNFVWGHNDADCVPVADLIAAAGRVLAAVGKDIAYYGLKSGLQGYLPLRQFVAEKLERRAAMSVTADQVLITSGSLQALNLINAMLLEPGDTVIVEEATYSGALARFRRAGVHVVGVRLDDQGIDIAHLESLLAELRARGVVAKYIYTIPTVQNPTGSVMSKERRLQLLQLAANYDTIIFEDDCYADLLWDGERPPSIRALDDSGRVLYCGSFSKSIAPALRVGYLVADWPAMAQILSLKNDAGSGALEQMVVADYAQSHFDDHVAKLSSVLRAKCQAISEAVAENFGAAAEISVPRGGIFIWVTLPPEVDTSMLAKVALAEGVAINPGAEWTADAEAGRHSMRLCFGSASLEDIRDGIALLADICHRETGIPEHRKNNRHVA